jgi:hypothetical protein
MKVLGSRSEEASEWLSEEVQMKDNNSVNIYWIDEYCRMLDNKFVPNELPEQFEFEQRHCKFLLCVLCLSAYCFSSEDSLPMTS